MYAADVRVYVCVVEEGEGRCETMLNVTLGYSSDRDDAGMCRVYNAFTI